MPKISIEGLKEYTVRIDAAGDLGTGFFIAPGLIMTCFHVVEKVYNHKSKPPDIYIWWKEKEQVTKYIATIEEIPPDTQKIDLAILRIQENFNHPQVEFDVSDLTINDKLYTFGYTKIGITNPKIQGEPVTIDYEGTDSDSLIKLKGGQITPGLSGSPLLNIAKGKICGVIKRTRSENSDLGGRAVPGGLILKTFPFLLPRRDISNNPFTPLQGKVSDGQYFFGRENELNWIFETLNEGSSVAIIGDTGSGKSSLLWAVKESAVSYLYQPRQPIYIDMSQVIDDNDFYFELCSQIGIPIVKGTFLTRALQKHENKFLLLLDEVANMTWKGFTNPVRNQLRGLANDINPPLRLVVAASQPLGMLFPDSSNMTSPFKGICREKRLKPWDETMIRKFILQRLAPTPIQFTEAEILQIINKSQGIPRDVMGLCHDLYKNHPQTIDIDRI